MLNILEGLNFKPNVFDLYNSEYVSQEQYDQINNEQKAFTQYIIQLQQDPSKISNIWELVFQVGIENYVYKHYKQYAKKNGLYSLEPIYALAEQVKFLDQPFDYISDFKKFMDIKEDHQLIIFKIQKILDDFEIQYDVAKKFEQLKLSEQDKFHVVCIESTRMYVDQVYNDDGFLEQLRDFTEALNFQEIPPQLAEFVHAEKCIKFIFESILYYPDSQGLLIELQQTMQVTKMYKELENSLLSNMKKRLLISGINTETILKFYINLLKVINSLDPDYQIFEKVSNPIKEYMLLRNDFLRCIISSIAQQNFQTERVVMPTNQDSSDDEQNKQEKDLTSVLVSLYGSQDAFISEYQNMIAEKILTPNEFNLQQELANIELLKIRFGEQQMQACSTMMKDISDSRRTDALVQSDKALSILKPLFISKSFWPISYDYKSTFQMPKNLENLFNEYLRRFSEHKKMRTLYWHHDLGSVSLTLTFDNCECDFKCLPIHATIIQYFNDIGDESISSTFLAKELQMNPDDLRRRIQYWINKGVIREIKSQNNNETRYYAVKYYKKLDQDNSQTDDIPEDLFVSSTNFLQSNQMMQQISIYLVDLLTQTGPLRQDKVMVLFKTAFKSEFIMPLTDNNVKEAIKIMIQKRKIVLNVDHLQLI